MLETISRGFRAAKQRLSGVAELTFKGRGPKKKPAAKKAPAAKKKPAAKKAKARK